MDLHISQEFLEILEKLVLPETAFFPPKQNISHKFLYLLYKAKMQIQPEILWISGNPSQFTILTCQLSFELFDFTYALHSEYNVQIGHPLTAHLYQGLTLADEYGDIFEIFVEKWLDKQQKDDTQSEISHQSLLQVDQAET